MEGIDEHFIYLASKSPRRQELLRQIGISFGVFACDIDESLKARESPLSFVKRLAAKKAEAAIAYHYLDDRYPVLAADTIVVLSDKIFGKPKDKNDAKQMLTQLSGQIHEVYTCVAIYQKDTLKTDVDISQVSFRKLSDRDINCYLQSKEYEDKAGAYAIQGLAAIFVNQLVGSYSGVMGLPLSMTSQLLGHFGIRLP